MKDLAFWDFVAAQLKAGQDVAWLQVVQSQGSSPGRQGFRMAVVANGEMQGSVGGGIMEHKLVEMLRNWLTEGRHFWEIKRQIHSKEAAKDQSGMICSGEQSLAMMRLKASDLDKVEAIQNALRSGKKLDLQLSHASWNVQDALPNSEVHYEENAGAWRYSECLGPKFHAHVIGAGHVGLATCKVLSQLDFHVSIYDDREGLNTFEANAFAHQKFILPYPELGNVIPEGNNQFVVVMTFGYRGDEEALRALAGQQFGYLGMMGSETKVAKMMQSLLASGISQEWLEGIKSPAGLVVHCHSPEEIAVSIAAEMIQVRLALFGQKSPIQNVGKENALN